MKKNFKKVVSLLLTTALSASVFAVSASAAVTLRKPLDCRFQWNSDGNGGSAYRVPVKDEEGNQTGWKVTKTAADYNGTSNIANIKVLANGSGSTTKFKNNFIYSFDFKATSIKGNVVLSIFSSGGINDGVKLAFVKDSKTEQYYIKQDNSGYALTGYNQIFAPDQSTVNAHSKGALLQFGKWYNVKIEGDMSQGANMYFTVTDNNGTEPVVYTGVCLSPAKFTETETLTADKNCSFQLWNSNACEFEMKNEVFTYDSFMVPAPAISTADGITASATCYNVSPIGGLTTPSVICAVYGENERLVAYKEKSATAGSMAGYTNPTTASSYAAVTTDAITGLADGTYTVKAFVWNDFDKMNPYKNVVSKTITVSGGTITEN